MPLLNKLSPAFTASIFYITWGALTEVWCIAWFIFFPVQSSTGYFLLCGSILSGIVFLFMGFYVGRIGRAAREAELPPAEVIQTVAQVEKAKAGQDAGVPQAPSQNIPQTPPIPAQQPPAQTQPLQ